MARTKQSARKQPKSGAGAKAQKVVKKPKPAAAAEMRENQIRARLNKEMAVVKDQLQQQLQNETNDELKTAIKQRIEGLRKEYLALKEAEIAAAAEADAESESETHSEPGDEAIVDTDTLPGEVTNLSIEGIEN
jgi:hypothetical protein